MIKVNRNENGEIYYKFENQEAILNNLYNWGYNDGDFEELVYLLANQDGIETVYAEIYEGFIEYNYTLNEKGQEIRNKWYSKNTSFERNKTIPDWKFEYTDEDSDSIKNTLIDWGIELEK